MRADAARNRARILQVAYETFAADGLGVPIDEIARRAGVGAGTVYRHFPAKEDLFRAVVADRIRTLVDQGRELAEADPAGGLYTFLKSMVLHWDAADRGLVDALAGMGIDANAAMPEAEGDFLSMLADLVDAGQRAGTVRPDVTVPEVKALMVGCQAAQAYNPDAAGHVTDIVFDGLRPHLQSRRSEP